MKEIKCEQNKKGLCIQRYVGEEPSEFKELLTGYAYGLLYELSEVNVVDWVKGNEINFDQLLEARLFSEEKELHIFENEGEWQAVEVTETPEAEYLQEDVALSKKFQTQGKKLSVKKYLDYDEDGQAYVVLTHLCGMKGGEA